VKILFSGPENIAPCFSQNDLASAVACHSNVFILGLSFSNLLTASVPIPFPCASGIIRILCTKSVSGKPRFTEASIPPTTNQLNSIGIRVSFAPSVNHSLSYTSFILFVLSLALTSGVFLSTGSLGAVLVDCTKGAFLDVWSACVVG